MGVTVIHVRNEAEASGLVWSGEPTSKFIDNEPALNNRPKATEEVVKNIFCHMWTNASHENLDPLPRHLRLLLLFFQRLAFHIWR